MTAGTTPLPPPAAPSKRKAVYRRRRIGESWYVPYLFILPHFAIFVLFVGWPLVFGIYISLLDFNLFADRVGRPSPFVGLENYIELFDPNSLRFERFWQTMWNTVIFVIISTPTLVLVALFLANLLNGRYPGRNFFRGLYFAPWTLSVAVIGLLWWWIFQSQGGLIVSLLDVVGIESPGWLTDQPWAWLAILIATVWWTVGFNTMILLAGMQSIAPDLYEASSIDGATRWQQFWRITVPLLKPILLLVVTLQVIASFNLVGQPQIITNGGPPTAETTPVLLHIYNTGFTPQNRYQLSPAAAMSFIVAAVMVVISVVNFKFFGSERA